jgi:hypothetical protein
VARPLDIYISFMAVENSTCNRESIEGRSINLALSHPYKDLV